MKRNLLKSLSKTLVALATVVAVVMGTSKDIKAADPTVTQSGIDINISGFTIPTTVEIGAEIEFWSYLLQHYFAPRDFYGPDVFASWVIEGNDDLNVSYGGKDWLVYPDANFSVGQTCGIKIETYLWEAPGAGPVDEHLTDGSKCTVNGKTYDMAYRKDDSNVKYRYIVINLGTVEANGKLVGGDFDNEMPNKNKAQTVAVDVPKEVVVDRDTCKSEAPHNTAGVSNINSKIGDLKVHTVNAITAANQKLLVDTFAQQNGKRARILVTASVHPRRDLGVDAGKKEALIWSNLEKVVQPVYAVCYNQTDKAYYISGILDSNGVAKLNNFILRDATNVTIFVLE